MNAGPASMSFEVEIKFRTNSHLELIRRLAEMGARAEPQVAHEDVYLSHPSRDFAQTNEAFRIRRIGTENRITYKGPRLSGPTKSREEIEVPFAEGEPSFEQLFRLFNHLGFRKVAAVRKTRQPYHLEYQGLPIEVVLDTAEGLGEFAEVEAFAAKEANLPAAQAAVIDLARELGLTDVEPRSYLRMHLDAEAARQ
ncbi:class IV adenylate cyclase [Singulisphaera acidiphila]|uniref:Adenylyl cyclase CyaB, putative n=1 Tax=Singulisphaera acidiphila (strain ATCC BAA-1392 / DSM 18658 / VKM B-2454 / MOB10) TaxID=886293 RepID=L0DL67_SINAD|nr:class IV adenylate cyclase [Singulisphaera acidiphila]AGA29391.1 adenylyl cyclase CyaB, putative [Singulisphaera acidiphila DSM 18658]